MIYLDFETRSVVDVTDVGSTRYATDTSTQALCLCYSFDEDPDVYLWHRKHPFAPASPRPDVLLERLADGEPWEAHNSGFEYNIWNDPLRREYPEFDVPLSADTMNCSAAKASCLSLPRALGDALKAVSAPEEFRKLEDGKRLITKLSKPKYIRRQKKIIGYEWCEDEFEHMRNWEYCAQDIRAERWLSNWCGDAMSEQERKYWLMDFRMNQRGIKLDAEAAQSANKLVEREVARLDAEMMTLTGGRVPGGSKRKQWLAWANDQIAVLGGSPLPNTQADTLSFAMFGVPSKAGDAAKAAAKPEMDAKWEQWGDAGRDLHRSIEICMEVNKPSVSKFKQMIASVCPDGRLHDIMLYNGADRTGRWSGRNVQPHNFVRGYTKLMPNIWDELIHYPDNDWIELVTGDKMLPALAKACRGALVASDGCELYAADFNAIEARKLAWMSGCAPMLTMFRTPDPDRDIYTDMASGIYSRDITKRDKDERQLGKKAVLGLGYEMGWEKFQKTVWNDEGIWLDDDFCKMVVQVYRREKYPEVPELWRAVEKAAINAVLADDGTEYYAGGDEDGFGAICYFYVEPFLYCRLPSGRCLAYLHPLVKQKIQWTFQAINVRGGECIVTFPAKPGTAFHLVQHHAEYLARQAQKTLTGTHSNRSIMHLSFMGKHIITRQWTRIGAYGGMLVENADQASSRDLLAEAMLRVDQTDPFHLLLSIHDEVIAEAPRGTCTVNEFEDIMAENPIWAPTMPITAEGWIGPRLRK